MHELIEMIEVKWVNQLNESYSNDWIIMDELNRLNKIDRARMIELK